MLVLTLLQPPRYVEALSACPPARRHSAVACIFAYPSKFI